MEEALSYHSLDALARRAEQAGKPISALVLADQAAQMELTPEALTARMDARLTVMEQAAAAGLRSDRRSDSGWSGGDACRMWGFAQSGRGLGDFFDRTLARALAGIRSNIPADQVIDAMKQVGELMPRCLKETAQAGLAAAPAAQISKNRKRPEEGTQHV